MKRILMTGGGTAGHVTPNIALVPLLTQNGYEVSYIGSYNGMEKNLIESKGIPYYGISSGKLRRYFDVKNFTDPLKVLKGYFESVKLIKKLKPNIVFSKGGFVSVPVVLAARHCGVPVIIHESDITPGLANKIAFHGAEKVCCNFPETLKYIPNNKGILTGTPIRKELFTGDSHKALEYCHFPDHNKPVLLVIGGSSGAQAINSAIRNNIKTLTKDFYVIHLCGKGHLDTSFVNISGYAQFEYAHSELADIFSLTDIIISRAGANSIGEFSALAKPNILIPLPQSQSRGDQILNAQSFVKQGFSVMIEEEQLTPELLINTLHTVYQNKDKYISAMRKKSMINSEVIILELINKIAK